MECLQDDGVDGPVADEKKNSIEMTASSFVIKFIREVETVLPNFASEHCGG